MRRKVEKAKGWPWSTGGSCQTSIGQRALRSHIAWAHPRGITPSTHSQHSMWLKSLPHALSSKADYLLASLLRLHYGSWHTLGVETTQPGAVWWDHRSKWASRCLSDSGESIYQWRCDPMSCLPNVPQRSNIDLVRWTIKILASIPMLLHSPRRAVARPGELITYA